MAHTFSGIVMRGSARARALGYPTLNIPLADASVSGIYAARVSFEGRMHEAAAFADPKRGVLEAHLFDYDADGYGKQVVMELCEKLRESAAYSDDTALKRAIRQDVEAARAYFKETG